MGVRAYLPSIGRFTAADPVLGGNDNAYVYPADPVNESDLNGALSINFRLGILWNAVVRIHTWGFTVSWRSLKDVKALLDGLLALGVISAGETLIAGGKAAIGLGLKVAAGVVAGGGGPEDLVADLIAVVAAVIGAIVTFAIAAFSYYASHKMDKNRCSGFVYRGNPTDGHVDWPVKFYSFKCDGAKR
jgi:hypothetical protein